MISQGQKERAMMRSSRWGALLLFVGLLLLSVHAEAAVSIREDQIILRIHSFDQMDGTNDLGGVSRIFFRPPSRMIQSIEARDSEKFLRLSYQRGEAGWCGWFTRLQTDAEYPDLAGATALAFRVRGEASGEIVRATLADEAWQKNEDSAKSPPLCTYLSEGITRDWQWVVIPLNDFGNLDLRRLVSVGFVGEGINREGVVEIDDLCFVQVSVSAYSNPPEFSPGAPLLIDDFEEPLFFNALGGEIRAVMRAPSWSELAYDRETGNNSSLRFRYLKRPEGFSLALIGLSRGYSFLDASSYNAVTFRIRGAMGGESLEVAVADADWQARDDAPFLSLELFLKAPLTEEWQTVTIPLFYFCVDQGQIAQLLFKVAGQGEGAVWIDDLFFVEDPQVAELIEELKNEEGISWEEVPTEELVSRTLPEEDAVIFWDPNESLQTTFGGYVNPIGAERLVGTAEEGSRRVIALTYDTRTNGDGGIVVEAGRAGYGPYAPRVLLDIHSNPVLSFLVKGEIGVREVMVSLLFKDHRLVVCGDLNRFVEGEVSSEEWREAVIQSMDFPPFDPEEFAGLKIECVRGSGRLELDRFAFKKSTDQAVAWPEAQALPASRPSGRALWVWNTEELLDHPEALAEFTAFLEEENVNRIFLQLLYVFESTESGDPTCRILRVEELRGFLRGMHRRGILVDAVDGFPTFALAPLHNKVMAQFEAVLAFNAGGDPDGRFDGIQYDIEPYTLPGWDGPMRFQLVEQYLTLIERLGARGREAGLPVWAAVPFWYDHGIVLSRHGKTATLEEFVIDAIDGIAVMDYRNFALGSDGAISHVQRELEYAAEQGKMVYVGLETYQAPPGSEQLPAKTTFDSVGNPALEQVVQLVEEELSGYPSFAGIAVHHYGSYYELIQAEGESE